MAEICSALLGETDVGFADAVADSALRVVAAAAAVAASDCCR